MSLLLMLRNNGSPYRHLILSKTPIGYWRLGESTGTTAVDIASGFNGDYTNTPTLSQTGALVNDSDTTVLFTGSSSQHVSVAHNTTLSMSSLTTRYGLCAWVNPTANGASNGSLIAGKIVGSADYSYALRYTSANKFSFTVNIGGSMQTVESVATYAPNTGWYYLCGTWLWDGGNTELYVNGVPSNFSTFSGTHSDGNGAFMIGGRPADTTRSFTGYIDEVALYKGNLTNVGISASESLTHYQFGKSFGFFSMMAPWFGGAGMAAGGAPTTFVFMTPMGVWAPLG